MLTRSHVNPLLSQSCFVFSLNKGFPCYSVMVFDLSLSLSLSLSISLSLSLLLSRSLSLSHYLCGPIGSNLSACLCHCSLICFVSLVFLVDCHSRCICGSAAEIAVAPAFGWALPGQLPTICSVPAPSSRNGLCREQRLL